MRERDEEEDERDEEEEGGISNNIQITDESTRQLVLMKNINVNSKQTCLRFTLCVN